jgi:acetyl-CoA C-acetyltransferase
VAAGTALDGTRALAAEILDGSPTSVRISLQVMEETRGIPAAVDAIGHPTTAFDDLMASDDALEGRTAFAQKRRPQWRNR